MAACSLAIKWRLDMVEEPSVLLRGEQIADTMVRLLPVSMSTMSALRVTSIGRVWSVNTDRSGREGSLLISDCVRDVIAAQV